jgi:hypothetical protein
LNNPINNEKKASIRNKARDVLREWEKNLNKKEESQQNKSKNKKTRNN